MKSNSRRYVATVVACLVFLSTASVAHAEREVVSDLDCVVEPSASVEIGAAVPGLLSETTYDAGDEVAAGVVMATLESGVEEVALAIAEELAASSTAIELRASTSQFGLRTLKRNEQLAKDDQVSQQTLDQVRTESDIAVLQLRQERESQVLARLEAERARAQLERRRVRSSIDSRVVQRFHAAGEYIDAEPVYRVVQLDPLHVEVIVPIEYLGVIEKGMNATVSLSVPGYENRPLSAIVTHVDSVADAASASYGVRLEMPNSDESLPSGVRCELDFFAS